ncbi:MAG: hypothetical protein LC099_02135 [Anaerolineales bacterium]|nr:hypothetical protein [Anaerolineales bacterium]
MPATPLTPEQQTRLKTNIALPLATILISLLAFGGFFFCMATSFKQIGALAIFFAVAAVIFIFIIGATGRHVYKNVQDLRGGLAEIDQARLSGKKRVSTSHGSPPTYYAEFERLGTFTITEEIYARIEEGQFCRIIYAPNSKVVFELNPL